MAEVNYLEQMIFRKKLEKSYDSYPLCYWAREEEFSTGTDQIGSGLNCI